MSTEPQAERADDIEALADLLTRSSAVIVVGSMGTGKSWLIEHAVQKFAARRHRGEPGDSHQLFRVKMGSTGKSWSRRIVDRVNVLLQPSGKSVPSSGELLDTLAAAVMYLGPLVFWIDDFDDTIADDPSTMEELHGFLPNIGLTSINGLSIVIELQSVRAAASYSMARMYPVYSQPGIALDDAQAYARQFGFGQRGVELLQRELRGHLGLYRQVLMDCPREADALDHYSEPDRLDDLLRAELTAMKRRIRQLNRMPRVVFERFFHGEQMKLADLHALDRLGLVEPEGVSKYRPSSVPVFHRALKRWAQ